MFKILFNIIEKIGICKHVDLIIPYIYLGNFNISQDSQFLKENNIKLIVNCSRNIPFIENLECENIRIPIDDNRVFKNKDILEYLYILEKIHKFRENKKNILIHCRAGSQRSANIILLYLTKILHIDFDTSYNLIKQKRPICFTPSNSFSHIYN
jgi:protein-tyrosine phosphatase|tara:strand:- start:209 stop:670 length:462 start_codon:yes stop_codon:yes gene_type:complete